MKHQHPDSMGYRDTPPEVYDGFGFYRDPQDGLVKFYYFDDVCKEHGPAPKDPTIPSDREAYHVMLSNVRKAVVYVDAPFISNFIDPFVYATGLAYHGFNGIMLKKTQWSANVVTQAMAFIRMLHARGSGYTYTDEDGVETPFPGLTNANT